ncbi:helix-turn-helix transcriptional regulator [Burkholderia gladioli]|uniref:helix-turn-helix transcriptional regulator n=1 Tax=Burkholderia gladioli TaxID=28095 RepID=UPI0016401F64|nr:helix-turn-helix transcriptional regulator [Burkholderia gladioli]
MRDSIVKLGRVISNVGTTRFFSAMQRFISGTVTIDMMHVSIWHTDPHLGQLVGASTIHGTALHDGGFGQRLPETLIEQILDPDGPRLIHLAPRLFDDESAVTPAHRCIILMRRVRTHFVVFLQREAERGDFRPDELASLGELSQALLPLVEQHASMQQPATASADDEFAPPAGEASTALPDSAADTLSQRFRERLEQQNITLSSREQQVCILILSGYTLPAICDELDLRASTIETYLKRARIKLGLSGRHGLSRWMIE